MKILVTNDDGIDALGLKLLARWAQKYGEVTVVAPKKGQSAKSHAIEIVEAFEIKQVPYVDGIEAWSVDSTPADCVRFGIVGLKRKYDIVFSGINKGVNVGDDIVYSGTISAVYEAVKQGVKAIAFSTFPDTQEEAAKHLDEAYGYILEHKLFDEAPMYNVNIPATPKAIRMTYQGTTYYSDDFEKVEGTEHMYRQVGDLIPDLEPNDLNRDTVAIHADYTSVTPLLETRTDMRVFAKFQKLNG